ncbi:hypothetical protein MTR67_014543 [Solanum verrucosum]|uniref:F-box associated beta-propeller type 1 domain-containing protein n=1 Tax=Solanum verrucosum TaxID=315347 RepID=A0AAF0TN72_SOLVR|nr:hypothetical protein MTR67_014543 [Solanum verrucosum]
MELQDDILLGKVIPSLPLKFVVQCKLLSKYLKRMISHPDFARTLYQSHKETSTQLIYSINGIANRTFYKISVNPTVTLTRSVLTLPYEVEIFASCNGLILFRFEQFSRYCVFNPVTEDHQLIPYPESATMFESKGLAVDYPVSDQYKVVTITRAAPAISKLVENSNLFYKFHVLSSEQPDLWREIQLRTNTFISLSYGSPFVYWRNSLYWLKHDDSVLAFDTKREEAILIDRPEFIDDFDQSYGKILTGRVGMNASTYVDGTSFTNFLTRTALQLFNTLTLDEYSYPVEDQVFPSEKKLHQENHHHHQKKKKKEKKKNKKQQEEEEEKKKKQEEQQKEEEEKKYCNRRGVLPFTIFKHDSICHFWETKEIEGIVKYCNRRGFLYAF